MSVDWKDVLLTEPKFREDHLVVAEWCILRLVRQWASGNIALTDRLLSLCSGIGDGVAQNTEHEHLLVIAPRSSVGILRMPAAALLLALTLVCSHMAAIDFIIVAHITLIIGGERVAGVYQTCYKHNNGSSGQHAPMCERGGLGNQVVKTVELHISDLPKRAPSQSVRLFDALKRFTY